MFDFCLFVGLISTRKQGVFVVAQIENYHATLSKCIFSWSRFVGGVSDFKWFG